MIHYNLYPKCRFNSFHQGYSSEIGLFRSRDPRAFSVMLWFVRSFHVAKIMPFALECQHCIQYFQFSGLQELIQASLEHLWNQVFHWQLKFRNPLLYNSFKFLLGTRLYRIRPASRLIGLRWLGLLTKMMPKRTNRMSKLPWIPWRIRYAGCATRSPFQRSFLKSEVLRTPLRDFASSLARTASVNGWTWSRSGGFKLILRGERRHIDVLVILVISS